MTRHVDELLPEYAFGMLSPRERDEVDAHVADCRRCAGDLVAVNETLAGLALELEPVTPSPAVRERLLASAGAGRFERFVERLSSLLDLGADRVRGLFAAIGDPGAWERFPIPGIELMHLPFGPRVRAADVGFVRVAAGMQFPYHKHLGAEHVVVLQGGLRDQDGTVMHAGDEAHAEAGSAHTFQVLEGEELIYLVILQGGVDFTPPSS